MASTQPAQRSRADDFKPPYPAYQAYPAADVAEYAMAMFGVQARDRADATGHVDRLLDLLGDSAIASGPEFVERAWLVDGENYYNDVLMAYWKGSAQMDEFLSSAPVNEVLATPLDGNVGIWVEALSAPLGSLDANYAQDSVHYGISRMSQMREQQFHSYMGSMRDRVPDFLAGTADGEPGQLRPVTPPDSFGRVLTTPGLPAKLCFIRGAFAWKDADQDEQDVFAQDMMPVYEEGALGLRDDGEETNCVSMRMAEEICDTYDTGVQSNALAWFLTLADLEEWTRSHPRHLAILKSIYGYMERFNFKPRLNLGHEVAVAPAGAVRTLYNNCHPATGFLKYFPSEPVPAPDA